MSSPSEKRTCQEQYEKKIKIQTFIPIKIEMEQTGQITSFKRTQNIEPIDLIQASNLKVDIRRKQMVAYLRDKNYSQKWGPAASINNM